MVKKVVIPAAGWGTRFLPQTKALPKEMLPIIDKPVIQYVVEEAVAAGIRDVIIVTGWHKRAIEDHFDRSIELENHLRSCGKEKELKEIIGIAQMANFIYIRQKGEKYGNAIPILTARPVVDDEYFAAMWGDEFIKADPPRLFQMLEVFKKYRGAVISGVRIESKEDLSRYGMADVEKVEGNVFKIKKIVEKPSPAEAPSNLATHGAYILPSRIFEIIANLKPGKGGEYWLPEAISELIKGGDPVYACELKNARYYDTGNKMEYLKTVIEFTLSHPDFQEEIRKYLKKLNL